LNPSHFAMTAMESNHSHEEPSERIDTRNLATRIRKHCLRMMHLSDSSHIGGCLSAADLLAQLYGGWLRVDPKDPAWPDRDRFILSKGHAAAALYAVLAEAGFFPVDLLSTYYTDGSQLPGHVECDKTPGVEVSTGSLGHGLPIAVGMALALKKEGKPSRVVALLSDGDCNEGSTWEAALLAPRLGLDNLLAVVDYNKIQALGRVEEVLPLEPLAAKWRSFGWEVREVDGHNHSQVGKALSEAPFSRGVPSAIVAHTTKGKGVSFMENRLEWHYRSPNEEQLARALAELEGGDRPFVPE